MARIDIEVLARTAYEAYRKAQKGPLSPWDDTSDQEKQGWRAAVSAVTHHDVTLADSGPVPSLVVQAAGQTQVFSTDFTAGRQENLAIGDEHASSHHARFQFAHGYWYVEDLKFDERHLAQRTPHVQRPAAEEGRQDQDRAHQHHRGLSLTQTRTSTSPNS